MIFGRLLIAALAAVLLAGPAGAQENEHDHVSELNGVRAIHAWTQATKNREALVFVDIENNSDEVVVLEGGEAEIAGNVTLLGWKLTEAAPTMVAMQPVPIKAGRELVLRPTGAALRLEGLSEPLIEGGEFEMELHFDIGHLEVHVAVEAADARQHSHAGHQH